MYFGQNRYDITTTIKTIPQSHDKFRLGLEAYYRKIYLTPL